MDLLPYIGGKRKGKEAHDLEKRAMRDPFLSDALDGFDTIQGDHAERIEDIRKRMRAKTDTFRKKIVYISFAASFFLCITVGGYFLFKEESNDFIAASSNPLVQEEVMPELERAIEEPLPAIAMNDEDENILADQSENLSEPLPPPPPSAPALSPQVDRPVEARKQAQSAIEKITLDDQLAHKEVSALEIAPSSQVGDSNLIAQKDAKKASDRAVFSGSMGQTSSMRNVNSQEKPVPVIGMKDYKKYLKSAMVRPTSGNCKDVKGKVIVEFKINKEGRPHDFSIREGLCEEANKEAIRLIENGSKWFGDTSQQILLEVKF